MDKDYLDIAFHLVAATVAGGVIGLERSYHGRPAGFRTHTLVSVASTLLMLVMLYEWKWLPGSAPALHAVQTDPTRMAQGIMTGIGFLGAGVIFKEGQSVRGLTTAASIWMTAAIGILIGVGFFYPAAMATLLTLGILSVFRRIESSMPSHSYAQHVIRFDRGDVMPEEQLRDLLRQYGFSVANMSYRATDDGLYFEYRMMLQTTEQKNMMVLAEHLRSIAQVRAFRISPTGD